MGCCVTVVPQESARLPGRRDGSRGSRGLRDLPRDVWILSVITFLVALGYGVMIPILPVFARTFGVGEFATGLVVALFAMTRLAANPAVGVVVRFLGLRAVLVAGVLVVSLSSAACGLADSYWQLLLMRGIGGLGSALFTISAMSGLLAVAGKEQRGRASALYGGGFLLGNMAGPALSGFVTGFSLRLPFFFYAGTLLCAGLVGIAALSLKETASDGQQRASQDAEREMTARVALRDRRYQAACWANFAQGWQSQGARSTLVPLLIVGELGLAPRWTGSVFAAAAVTQGLSLLFVGRAVDEQWIGPVQGRRRVFLTGAVLCTVASVGLVLAPNIGMLLVTMCVFGVGGSMLQTSPTALVGDVAGKDSRGPVAVFQMFTDAGTIIGPLLGGALAEILGLRRALAAGAVVMLVTVLMGMRIPGGERRAR